MLARRPPARLDLKLADLVLALGCLGGLAGPAPWKECLSQRTSAHPLLCNSVRAGFDVLLQNLRLPPGSKVVISGISIPEMFSIIERQGLVPVALDYQENQWTHGLEQLEQALDPQVRALVLCHLFGYTMDFSELIEVAQKRGLFVIEDCAQCFGAGYLGHPQSDCAMFSFGPIKCRTALGGALFLLASAPLRERMEETLARFERRSEGFFLRRLLKYAALSLALKAPFFGALMALLKAVHRDPEGLLYRATRAFSRGTFQERYGWRLSRGQEAFLTHRLLQFDSLAQGGSALPPRVLAYNRWLLPVFPGAPGYAQAYPSLPSSMVAYEGLPQARRILEDLRFLPQC